MKTVTELRQIFALTLVSSVTENLKGVPVDGFFYANVCNLLHEAGIEDAIVSGYRDDKYKLVTTVQSDAAACGCFLNEREGKLQLYFEDEE